MESGTIVRWLKAEGDTVEKGEPLYELDTDKVTQEVEAEAAGVLLKILVAEGEDRGRPADRGHRRAGRGRSAPSRGRRPSPTNGREEASRPGRERRGARAGASRPTAGRQANDDARAAVASRRRRSRGVSRASAASTSRACAAPAPTGGSSPRTSSAPARARACTGGCAAPLRRPRSRIPLTSVRKTIARRLTEAWQAPVFQISSLRRHDARRNELRARLVERGHRPKPTVTDILTKLVAVALLRHRELNAHFAERRDPPLPDGERRARRRRAARPGRPGHPVGRAAHARPDRAGAQRDRHRAREATSSAARISRAGRSRSRTSACSASRIFTAVLNPPQAAILAVGAIDQQPVAVDDGYDVRTGR